MSDKEKIEPLLKNANSSRQKPMAPTLLKKISSQQNIPLEASAHSTDIIGEPNQTASVLNKENEPNNNPVFKAVGVIQGEVNFGEDGTNTITINGITYRLKYASEKRRTLDALKLEIKNTGKNIQRLIVYPRVIHFPRIDQPLQNLGTTISDTLVQHRSDYATNQPDKKGVRCCPEKTSPTQFILN